MAFDVEGAKQAGYSDAEIAGHLAATMKFDAEGARKAGYSDQEIIAQLANPASAAPRWEEPNPTFAAGDPRYALPPAPIVRSLPASVADIVPRDGAVPRIVGATTEGFRKGMAGRTDPAALAAQEQFNRTPIIGPINAQLIGPAMKLAGGVMGAAGGAFGQGAYELGNLYSPELGRDAFMVAQVAGALWPLRARIPSPKDLAAAPRVNPMMEAFDRAEATRAEQPSRPAPPDPVESNIAKVQSQLGVRDAPPPAPSGTPAERAPPGIPPGTEVPTSLQIQAAIDTADTQPTAPPRPSFAPAVNVDPMTGQAAPVVAPSIDRVPPGASGPATVPYGPSVSQAKPPPVAAPVEPPAPGSVGAAASREGTEPSVLTAKTPAQALNDFKTSVTQTVRDRARPGAKEGTVEDHNVYVPEVRRLESARVFDPDVAGNHDVMMDIDPAYRNAVKAHEQEIHDILKEKYLNNAGDTNSVEALKEQRAAVSPDALGVFRNERPVDAQPVVNAIREILDGPTGKIDAVRNTLQRIEKQLYNKDGQLEALPSQLYGARRNLTTIRDSKGMTQEASDAATSRREMGQVLTVLDRVIGQGANGFSDVYLPQWAHFSRLIDQQSYLQGKTLGPGKVTDVNGNLTANGMQKLLEQIAVDKGKPGNSRAKTLTEEQLNDMVAIRNELAAMQYRDQLAKSHGSPTVKKAAAAARLGISIGGMSPEAIDAAIHAVLAKTTLGAGNAVYQFGVKPILENRRERKAGAIMDAQRNRLLNKNVPTE